MKLALQLGLSSSALGASAATLTQSIPLACLLMVVSLVALGVTLRKCR